MLSLSDCGQTQTHTGRRSRLISLLTHPSLSALLLINNSCPVPSPTVFVLPFPDRMDGVPHSGLPSRSTETSYFNSTVLVVSPLISLPTLRTVMCFELYKATFPLGQVFWGTQSIYLSRPCCYVSAPAHFGSIKSYVSRPRFRHFKNT